MDRLDLLSLAVQAGGVYAAARIALAVFFPTVAGLLCVLGPFVTRRWPTGLAGRGRCALLVSKPAAERRRTPPRVPCTASRPPFSWTDSTHADYAGQLARKVENCSERTGQPNGTATVAAKRRGSCLPDDDGCRRYRVRRHSSLAVGPGEARRRRRGDPDGFRLLGTLYSRPWLGIRQASVGSVGLRCMGGGFLSFIVVSCCLGV